MLEGMGLPLLVEMSAVYTQGSPQWSLEQQQQHPWELDINAESLGLPRDPLD